MATVAVCLEHGSKLWIASAVEWPGWTRGGKGEEAALEALTAYAKRYAAIARAAGEKLPEPVELEVIARIRGGGAADFGVPEAKLPADLEPLAPKAAARLAGLVEAGWRVFDKVVAGAPAELRKGPRGGGRDRDKIVEHVLGAEVAYARRIGLRGLKQPAVGDADAIAEHRETILTALRAAAPPAGEKDWPVPYAARRIAWHVIDHAWEIEDRAER
jgi:hypothetical protein